MGGDHQFICIGYKMTYDLKMVQMCMVCIANVYGLNDWQVDKRIWVNRGSEMINSIVIHVHVFCTHLIFDLILSLRSISRLGTHLYCHWHTSRITKSMDLPSKVKIKPFHLNGQATNCSTQTPFTSMDRQLTVQLRALSPQWAGN